MSIKFKCQYCDNHIVIHSFPKENKQAEITMKFQRYFNLCEKCLLKSIKGAYERKFKGKE